MSELRKKKAEVIELFFYGKGYYLSLCDFVMHFN